MGNDRTWITHVRDVLVSVKRYWSLAAEIEEHLKERFEEIDETGRI